MTVQAELRLPFHRRDRPRGTLFTISLLSLRILKTRRRSQMGFNSELEREKEDLQGKVRTLEEKLRGLQVTMTKTLNEVNGKYDSLLGKYKELGPKKQGLSNEKTSLKAQVGELSKERNNYRRRMRL
jgi:predicted  nucleic acid-binding Zn-ribbon protein